MKTITTQNVTSFKEALYKKQAAELYAKHDSSNSENPCETFTAGGASILDDAEFFLSHDQFSALFEQVFRQHLKDFSDHILERQAHD